MNTSELLVSLGWPAQDADAKGSLVWQARQTDPESLPATASLVVTPRVVRATVINIAQSFDRVEPHLQAEWDIEGPAPRLKKFTLMGVDTLEATNMVSPVEQFNSMVALINAPRPKIDIMGYRNKASAPVDPSAPTSAL